MTQSTYLHCAIFSGKSSLVRQELTFLSPSQKTMWIILATFVSSNAVFKPTGLGIDPVPFLQTHETLRQRMASHKSLDWEYATTMLIFQKAIRSLIFRKWKTQFAQCCFFASLYLFGGGFAPFLLTTSKNQLKHPFFPWELLWAKGSLTNGGLLYIFTSSHLSIYTSSSHLLIFRSTHMFLTSSLSPSPSPSPLQRQPLRTKWSSMVKNWRKLATLVGPAATISDEMRLECEKMMCCFCEFAWSC